jgi:hypothetical protein
LFLEIMANSAWFIGRESAQNQRMWERDVSRRGPYGPLGIEAGVACGGATGPFAGWMPPQAND